MGDADALRTCTREPRRSRKRPRGPLFGDRPHTLRETTMTNPKKTGAGAEAAEGIHSADRPRNEEKNTSLENADRQADGDERRGSGPTTSHSTEHQSKYGGGGKS